MNNALTRDLNLPNKVIAHQKSCVAISAVFLSFPIFTVVIFNMRYNFMCDYFLMKKIYVMYFNKNREIKKTIIYLKNNIFV